MTSTTPIKFLCSYGGLIMPRNIDGKLRLRYIGGYNRVLSVERSISFSELMVRLVEFCGASVRLKCQLPEGDLETLISITSDEDLVNILSIYDDKNVPKIRAILSPPKSLKSISPPPPRLNFYHYGSLVTEARCCHTHKSPSTKTALRRRLAAGDLII